ncbi:MAG: MerR family transcriptional regulator [Chloroflexi bacterium]|nr:MerR family transcriptional regulator [Chloroflexota bacterium]MDA1241440.1 MerR family transcriptional regulator [Chloroflexota bacterium]
MNYTVRAAARATGVTEGRLRTWERRYGIPKPARSTTGRRLYDDDDLAMIRRMVALTDAGVSAAEVAEAVFAESAAGSIPLETPSVPVAPDDPAVAALVTAARALDERDVVATLDRAIATHGWPDVFDRVIFPALRLTGDAWERGKLLPAHEHFLSELLRRTVMTEVARTPLSETGTPVVLACPPAERHDQGLLGLWLALRSAGMHVIYLGSDVPKEALLAVIEQVRPAAVVLIAIASTSRAEMAIAARAVTTARGGPRVYLGGPAVEAGDGVAELLGVRLPPSLREAAATVAAGVSVG